MKLVKNNISETDIFRISCVLLSLLPTVLYFLMPFGPIVRDDYSEIIFYTWYAPYIFFWFLSCNFLLSFLMCLPHGLWNKLRLIIIAPVIISSLFSIFYFLCGSILKIIDIIYSINPTESDMRRVNLIIFFIFCLFAYCTLILIFTSYIISKLEKSND